MTAVKEYRYNGHLVHILVIYPIANFDHPVYNAPDVCHAKLVATINGSPFETLEDKLSVVQARVSTIEADIATAINTFNAQETIANTTFQTALINQNYTINQN
jgi:hypothetical protein